MSALRRLQLHGAAVPRRGRTAMATMTCCIEYVEADNSAPSPEPVASPQYGNSRSSSPSPQPVKPFRDDPSDDEGEPEQSHHDMMQQQRELMDGECLTRLGTGHCRTGHTDARSSAECG